MRPTEIRAGTDNRRAAAIGVLLGTLFATANSNAQFCQECQFWHIEVVCPDEFTGPPDCFSCQIFGSTAVYEPHAYMYWEGRDAVMTWPMGEMDVIEGENVYYNHFTCPYSSYSISAAVYVSVDSPECCGFRNDFDDQGMSCDPDY